MPFHASGDIALHYQLADYTDPWRGSETVLLHHGFARNMEFWRAWVPLLARDYRVLRLDARGCGRSAVPPPGAPYTLDLLVDDALGLMDALGIERVHWAAEASGGHVGLALALRRPERIATLTLCNTPFKLPQATNDLFVADEVRAHGLGYWARKTLRNRIDVDKIDPGWIDWSSAEFQQVPPHVAIAQHDMIAAGDLLPRLGEIGTPALIMAGADSRIAPREQMERMKGALPNAKLVLLEGYGQGIAFMAPERCVAEMKAFIRSAARPS
jgi:pimeloyl-ACP methyl ester carboxylesterase